MKTLVGCGLFVLVVVGAVFAQDKTTAVSSEPMAVLTSEVRLLRLAIEKGTQAQTQIQGLSVYLSAQQSRLIQLSTRLDGLRRELDVAITQAGVANERAADVQKSLLSGQLDAVERKAVEGAQGAFKNELARATARENDLRNREAQAAGELQTELARWTDLIGRLEQAIKQ